MTSDGDGRDLREEDEENDDNGENAGEDEDTYLSDGVEEEDDDSDFGDNILNGLDDSAVVEDCSWSVSTVITKEYLLAAQREDLRSVMDLLSLSEGNARTLLIRYRWDVERIFELLDRKGRRWLFSEAGITIAEKPKHYALSASSAGPGPVTCAVCFEKFPSSGVTEMGCGHFYCNGCWTEYFIIQIKEGQSRHITCMTPACKTICDEDVVRNFVGANHRDIVDRFDRFLLESYIEDNNMVKWCPSVPHCGNAIRVKGDIIREVECTCRLQFCFSCLAEAHSPCSCLMWELWLKKCRDKSINWIAVNTKPCPKCQKPVHKDGGCNLVVCICGQPFCWICGGAVGQGRTWEHIIPHSCGRFGEEQKKSTQLARAEVYRYTHYYSRYNAHTESLMLERELEKTISGSISNLVKEDDSWITNGLNTLFRSRSILSYSYPFAYCMFGEELFKDAMNPRERQIKQNLFEDQQQQLESNVERLSSILGKGFFYFYDDTIMEARTEVIALSSIVDGLCKKIYEYIENDLLGPVQENHNISPYKSKHPLRAPQPSMFGCR